MSITGLIIGSGMFGVVYFALLININPLSAEDIGKLERLMKASEKINKVYQKLSPLLRILTVKSSAVR